MPSELLEAARERLQDLESGEPRNAIVAAWLGLETSAAATGLPRLAAETSTDYTERVIGVWPVDSERLGDLAALYREARFSVHDFSARPTVTAPSTISGCSSPTSNRSPPGRRQNGPRIRSSRRSPEAHEGRGRDQLLRTAYPHGRAPS